MAELQNGLQSAAKGSTKNIPHKEVYHYMTAHPGVPLTCNMIATHYNVIGNAKAKIAKDLSMMYLRKREQFVRDMSQSPYVYMYKATDDKGPVIDKGGNSEWQLGARIIAHLNKHYKHYLSTQEISEAMKIPEIKISRAIAGQYRAGKTNGLVRIANGKGFKYAMERKQASLPVATPEAPSSVASLSGLIAEVITLDERTRAMALKIGQLMSSLSPAVLNDFLSWTNTLTEKK